jgi:hypothetical protein
MERFNLKKLKEVERREVSNRFAARNIWTLRWMLMLLQKDERISKFQPKSLGYYDLKKHKPWFDEGCSKLLDQRKQVKLQRLQDASEMNDNLNNVRHEASRHFRNKKSTYLKDKIKEQEQ